MEWAVARWNQAALSWGSSAVTCCSRPKARPGWPRRIRVMPRFSSTEGRPGANASAASNCRAASLRRSASKAASPSRKQARAWLSGSFMPAAYPRRIGARADRTRDVTDDTIKIIAAHGHLTMGFHHFDPHSCSESPRRAAHRLRRDPRSVGRSARGPSGPPAAGPAAASCPSRRAGWTAPCPWASTGASPGRSGRRARATSSTPWPCRANPSGCGS